MYFAFYCAFFAALMSQGDTATANAGSGGIEQQQGATTLLSTGQPDTGSACGGLLLQEEETRGSPLLTICGGLKSDTDNSIITDDSLLTIEAKESSPSFSLPPQSETKQNQQSETLVGIYSSLSSSLVTEGKTITATTTSEKASVTHETPSACAPPKTRPLLRPLPLPAEFASASSLFFSPKSGGLFSREPSASASPSPKDNTISNDPFPLHRQLDLVEIIPSPLPTSCKWVGGRYKNVCTLFNSIVSTSSPHAISPSPSPSPSPSSPQTSPPASKHITAKTSPFLTLEHAREEYFAPPLSTSTSFSSSSSSPSDDSRVTGGGGGRGALIPNNNDNDEDRSKVNEAKKENSEHEEKKDTCLIMKRRGLPKALYRGGEEGFEMLTLVLQGAVEIRGYPRNVSSEPLPSLSSAVSKNCNKDDNGQQNTYYEKTHLHSYGGIVKAGDGLWVTVGGGGGGGDVYHEELHSQEFASTGGFFEMVQLRVGMSKKSAKNATTRYLRFSNQSIPSVPLYAVNEPKKLFSRGGRGAGRTRGPSRETHEDERPLLRSSSFQNEYNEYSPPLIGVLRPIIGSFSTKRSAQDDTIPPTTSTSTPTSINRDSNHGVCGGGVDDARNRGDGSTNENELMNMMSGVRTRTSKNNTSSPIIEDTVKGTIRSRHTPSLNVWDVRLKSPIVTTKTSPYGNPFATNAVFPSVDLSLPPTDFSLSSSLSSLSSSGSFSSCSPLLFQDSGESGDEVEKRPTLILYVLSGRIDVNGATIVSTGQVLHLRGQAISLRNEDSPFCFRGETEGPPKENAKNEVLCPQGERESQTKSSDVLRLTALPLTAEERKNELRRLGKRRVELVNVAARAGDGEEVSRVVRQCDEAEKISHTKEGDPYEYRVLIFVGLPYHDDYRD